MHNIAQRHHHHHRQRRLVWWHEAAAAGGTVLLGFVCVVTALVSVYVCEYMCQSRNKERRRETERLREAGKQTLGFGTTHLIPSRSTHASLITCGRLVICPCVCVFFFGS